ncbi:unnamed protein product [Lathyrus sativus]|nr:unnamed protein product [Lathyrus sativus]
MRIEPQKFYILQSPLLMDLRLNYCRHEYHQEWVPMPILDHYCDNLTTKRHGKRGGCVTNLETRVCRPRNLYNAKLETVQSTVLIVSAIFVGGTMSDDMVAVEFIRSHQHRRDESSEGMLA